ncbi:MAG: SPOR domain-containing protein [Pedobacter sp.]|nr:SPOR domain-containing protein [Pedobacter sp.]
MARATTKKSAPRKGASRNSKPAARKSSGGVPGWLWLLLGLAFGLFGAFLWHLWELREEGQKKETSGIAEIRAATPQDEKEKPLANTPSSNANSKGEEPRFDFYTLLPNQEVMPGKQPQAEAPKPAAAVGYVLQAGSFKSEAEADKRRASILMLGLPVKVQKVPGNETWYRVLVGPFADKKAAQDARNTLKGSGVEALAPKQG